MTVECPDINCRLKFEVPMPQSADPETSHPRLTKVVPEEVTAMCPRCNTFVTVTVYVTRYI
jgi:hypothetical protein